MEVEYHWHQKCFLCNEKKLIEKFLLCHPRKENVWLSKKCVYGLGDASRKWCNRMKSFLLSTGLKMSKEDAHIFCYYNDNLLRFHWQRKSFCFLISTFTHGRKWFWNYFRPEKPFRKIETTSNYDNEGNLKDLLHSQIGKLLWMNGQTGPDIASDVC